MVNVCGQLWPLVAVISKFGGPDAGTRLVGVLPVCMVSYAAWRWKVALGVVLAIAASLLIAAVQVLPTYEATAMKAFDPKYGAGIRDLEFYIPYFLPNYFDNAMGTRAEAWTG